MFFKNWKDYGLSGEPTTGDNAVHASASPFEALAEKMNWLGVDMEADEFGKELIGRLGDNAKDLINTWKVDPKIQVPKGCPGDFDVESEVKETEVKSLFDSVEDTDAGRCLGLLGKIAGC